LFAVSTTVSVEGILLIFPNIVVTYLGFTVVLWPPIIAIFLAEYRYCPRRRLNQRKRLEEKKFLTDEERRRKTNIARLEKELIGQKIILLYSC
jgi:UPF0716 family protein affecting phage T7 exclusion